MKEKEEEEKRENQKIADLLFDLDSRLLGMEMLGRFDTERIVTILDMTKFESDQKIGKIGTMTFTYLDMNPQRDKIFELLRSKNVAEVKLGLMLCPKEPADIIEMFKETVFLTPVMHYFFYIYAYSLMGIDETVKQKRHAWQLLEEGCHKAYSWGSTIRKDIEGFDEEDMEKISCRNYYKHSLNLNAFKREP